MLDFVRLLKRRYQTILNHAQDAVPLKLAVTDHLRSLVLSEAFIEKGIFIQDHPNRPLQIAVIGPTQAGKSSVVNLLLEEELAGVSPLAGFTTFPQGFFFGIEEENQLKIGAFFHDYQSNSPKEATKEPSRTPSLRRVSDENHPHLTDSVIWDTPDFDSIHSANYYSSLLRTIALADVILLVVSKDKYADQSVWDLLSLIEPLGQPTVVFLNKIQQENSPVVIQSFSEKWRNSRTDPMPPIVSLPFFNEGITALNTDREHQHLIAHLQQAQTALNSDQHRHNCAALLNRHWSNWTEAVRQEQTLLSEWDQLIEDVADNTIEIYQHHYLNHPQHFDTLKRALAELLSLLEIPGVAPILTKTREFLTWPVRRLLRIGVKPSHNPDEQLSDSQEIRILERMYEHFIVQLSNKVITKRGGNGDYEHWWKEISTLLSSENEILLEHYHQSMRSYQKEFLPEIEEAARRLYLKLEQQPATLNSLRATRLTTDAAAVALALKTGGIGVQDFVITPAVLALTSFLTESALGHYMNRIEAELKQKQLNAVRSTLFDIGLNKQLRTLPERMTQTNPFNISVESLRDAEIQLQEF